MKVKRLFSLKGLVLVFAAWWLISAPLAAASMVHKGSGFLTHAGHSLQTFLTHL